MTNLKKSFGQHFLKDKNIAKRIVESANFDLVDLIVEVGPGDGALTQHIVEKLKHQKLILIEADRDLISNLKKKFSQAEVIQADAAQIDFEHLVSKNKWLLIGNLPYNAASAIIMNALSSKSQPEELVVMVQKEQANRMLAKPGDMGILSVAVQLLSSPRKFFDVEPGSFQPAPKVDSSVIKLEKLNKLDLKTQNIISLAKAGFASRRKQLHGNLAAARVASSAEVKTALKQVGKPQTARAQELSVEDWSVLSSALK